MHSMRTDGPWAIPPFAALRAFEAVGRLGGIRRAAIALSLHHTVVSRHISALEQWTGMVLVNRARGGGLTEKGRRYHARVAFAMAELAEATAELMPQRDDPRISVWANGGFAAKWLGPQLIAFGAANPGIDIELRPSDTAPDLLDREADIDIRFFGDAYSPRPGGKGLKHQEFARPVIMAVAGTSLTARVDRLETPEQLLAFPLLHEESDDQWRAWFEAYGVVAPGRLPGPRLWHAHLAIDAAAKGRGVALASSFLVADDLEAGRLVQVVPRHRAGHAVTLGGYVFTTREDRWSSPPLVRLRHWLKREAGLLS